jgi:CheY-like chemotaxis protein
MALIVVADDEFLLTEMLSAFLGDAGHEVLTAANGQMALRLVRERRPQLLITDFMMPLMTGLELANAIRADSEIAGLPIVLATGAQGTQARRHADLFQQILDKPYNVQRLLDLVNALVRP